ncbi:TetR/AcrR family transcriptional regulator [Cohaesibacter gelatinilyticus]|uniref:Transcriptional regulator, TetR family n=1 Tax=Cohaesibacter gelatinilyticus TaxID=372072 RepID=A0A285NEI2_9HYPH|nr:TetR/AcrR family transcriptional regulator [Cohaesibacter gelatinilyticus]SNZ07303.1 transcriptional regulator, TetR family [Cohaesibacter gelatinilyticus]HAT87374.1 TetR/AcrR family transcriptional regulator [Hyphomicrobiales bacterium]
MARTRAADYGSKRRSILDQSAKVFAAQGYDKTSMAQIAKTCGFSKALLYHYYENKEALLTDIIQVHLEELLNEVQAAVNGDLPPKAQLQALVTALLLAYEDADDKHKLQINELSFLPKERQVGLKQLERDLVTIFADAVIAASPAVASRDKMIMPVTMSLFGILNWTYLWFRPTGDLTRTDYAELVTNLIIDGTRHLQSSAGT